MDMNTTKTTPEISSKKQQILDHAARLFREKGFAASTMRDLAESVGLEPSSLYNHISSKAEILRLICLTNAARFTEGIQDIRLSESDPSDQLRQVIRLHVSIATADNSSITVFNDEWRHLDEASLDEFLKMRKFYESTLRQILEEGIQCGHLKKYDIQILMYSLLSSLKWVHEYYRKDRMGEPEEVAGAIADMWLGGLADGKFVES